MKKLMLLLFYFTLFSNLWAQEYAELESVFSPNVAAYINISPGLNYSFFKDLNTSPLKYSGVRQNLNLTYLKSSMRMESEKGIHLSFGSVKSDFNNQEHSSTVTSFQTFYMLLFRLPRFSSTTWNVKIGGQVSLAGNIRTNAGLQNYALGVEFFPNLFLTTKIERDISRKEQKVRRGLFRTKVLEPRKKKLSYQLHVGVLNNNIRLDNPTITHGIVSNSPEHIVDAFKLEKFKGFTISSSLDYTYYLKNKNAFRLSYLWSVSRTGNDGRQFEMANHSIQFALLFNTNNQ